MNYANSAKILIPILCLLLSYKSISQNSDSSTRIPNSQLREAAKLIEQGKIDAQIVAKQDSIIKLQQYRMTQKDNQIRIYMANEKSFRSLEAAYKKQLSLMEQSAGISTQWITSLNRQLKRSRTSTVLVGVAGLAGILLTAYLVSR